MSPTNITLSSEAGSYDIISITSNTEWTARVDSDWLDLDQESGRNNGVIQISARSQNNSTTSRHTNVTISGGGLNRTVTVSQAGSSPILNVSPTDIYLGSGIGSSDILSISSNVEWSVSTDASWLSVTPTNGENNDIVTLTTVTENTLTSSRSEMLTISGGGLIRYINVTQNGSTPLLLVNPTNVTLGNSAGSSETISVTSNINWEVDVNSEWLTLSPVVGTENGIITLTARTENPTTNSRSSIVTIRGGGFSRTVTVTQAGSDPQERQ